MKRFYELIHDHLPRLTFPNREKEPYRGPLPIITVSREMGSGGTAIANMVARRLGNHWKVYDQEIIEDIAREAHLEKKLVRSIDEKKIPLVDELIAEVFGRRYLSMSGYYKHLIRVLSLIGQQGHAIILGRGANFIFPHSLKIRIICDMNQRIAWEMTYENISRGEAIKRIADSDEERTDFVKILYNHNPNKAHHYDIVIRTGPNLTIEDATDIILDLAKRRFKI